MLLTLKNNSVRLPSGNCSGLHKYLYCSNHKAESSTVLSYVVDAEDQAQLSKFLKPCGADLRGKHGEDQCKSLDMLGKFALIA